MDYVGKVRSIVILRTFDEPLFTAEQTLSCWAEIP
jgi:hypothetical protein